jgi:restriction endonuclease S subunit
MYFEGDQTATPSDNVLVLRLQNHERLRPFYVCIFLNSPFGQAQTRRLTKQSLQEVINQTSIQSLVIPAPDPELQKQVEDDVLQRLKRIDELKAQIDLELNTAGDAAGNCLFPQGIKDISGLELADIMTGVDTLVTTANKNSSRMKRKNKAAELQAEQSFFTTVAE